MIPQAGLCRFSSKSFTAHFPSQQGQLGNSIRAARCLPVEGGPHYRHASGTGLAMVPYGPTQLFEGFSMGILSQKFATMQAPGARANGRTVSCSTQDLKGGLLQKAFPRIARPDGPVGL